MATIAASSGVIPFNPPRITISTKNPLDRQHVRSTGLPEDHEPAWTNATGCDQPFLAIAKGGFHRGPHDGHP